MNSSFTIDSAESTLNITFADLQISALYKACRISPQVKNITLGPQPSAQDDLNQSYEDRDTSLQEKTSELQISSNHKEEKRKSRKKKLRTNTTPTVTFEESFDEPVVIEGITIKKLLSEIEQKRLLNVTDVMRERIKNWEEYKHAMNENLLHCHQIHQQQEQGRKILLEQKILEELQKEGEKSKIERNAELLERNKENIQKAIERNKKVKEAEEEARMKTEEILRKNLLLDKIFECQKSYADEYRNMLDIMKTCTDKGILHSISAPQSATLKDCATAFERVIKTCKTSEITDELVEEAASLVKIVKEISESINEQIKKANEAEEIKIKNEETKAEEAQKAREVVKVETPIASVKELSEFYFNEQSLNKYLSFRTYLNEFESIFKQLQEDPQMKKLRFDCQKGINIPVNAISDQSPSHILDKYVKLQSLLQGQSVIVGDTQVNASVHPQGIAYCKFVLAKKFVNQGAVAVSSKPDAAFPFASVLVHLWVDFPDFGDLVLAFFYTECPYLAPVFLPQIPDQSIESYYQSLGYRFTDNGTLEKQDMFLKRMSGIMRLFAAVLITKLRPSHSGQPNPLGLSEAWRWLSSILNLEPRPDICATLLYHFLEVTSNQMLSTFGEQFKKILAYICQEYYPKLEKITPKGSGGPLVRLEQFLQKVLKGDSVAPPEGFLPSNFW